MDPRRACWESSSEDVTRPLLPVHEDRPAGRSCCAALGSVLASRYLAVASGPLACALICAPGDLGGHPAARNMLGVLAWVFLWWITDAVPLAVASMAPLFLFPAFGIATADDVAKAYMDDVISLVLGSFILALAIEHFSIHRRLALYITSLFCGDPVKPHLMLLGICGTTVFISVWVHNTPCTVMMIQVATGILQRCPRDQLEAGADARELQRFSKALVLGITYASTVGGMATLTGTGANIILVGMWSTYFPEQRPITFSSWMSFGLPMALILFVALWATLCLMYCTKNTGRVLSAYLDRSHLRRELSLMGPMAFAEKMVLAVFGALIVLWMTRSLTDDIPGWAVLFDGKVGDGTVTILMTTLLFIIPSGKNDGEKLMDWGKCRKLQWHIILLLGAGFAIADGFKSSGLTDILSSGLGFLKGAPALAIAPAVCLFSGIITEFTSDDATTTLVLPLLAELGKSIGVHPLLLMVPGTVGAQLSYLLPTATPGNVVGFGTGYITIKDMVLTGIPMKLAGIAALTILLPTLGTGSILSLLPFLGQSDHGSATRLLGELVGGRHEGAAAGARGQAGEGPVLLGAQGDARQQVPGGRVGAGGVRADLRAGGPRRAPRGAQHARRPGLGVPLVDHGRRAARRRVHGAAVPLPRLRHLLLRRRRQGLHGRRHLPRPRQLHPRARHRALQHPPPPRPQHHGAVLRGPGEAAPAAAGHLRHDHVHQHVDPQHSVHRDDDAGGDGDPAAAPARRVGGRLRLGCPRGPAVLQGGGARRRVRVGDRRHGHADGHGREHHPGGDVVHLLPGAAPHHLQLLDVLRAPHLTGPVRGALGHALPHVLLQEHREGSLRLPRQEPPQKGAQLAGSDGICREDGFGRLWGSHCSMDDQESDGRHPWVGSPLRRQSWGWNGHYPDGDAAVHHPERQERRREAHGLGQVPEAAVAHHPAPRRGLRHRRRVQVERPDGHPLPGPGLPARRAGAGHRARGLRLQRPHHRVHLRRRHHHAGAAAAGRAGQVHRRAPAAAHGPRRDRRAAVVPAAHRVARECRRLRHWVHHHQGHGVHRDAAENCRRRGSDDPSANTRFSGFWHGLEVVGTCTGYNQMFWNISVV